MYIYFVDNLLLFPTVKKLVNSWWSYCKKFDTIFFWKHGIFHTHAVGNMCTSWI